IHRLSVSFIVLMTGLLVEQTSAQAPGLAWATNLGAQVFAVDGQTNVYANAGGTVFVLNGNGAVLQTNGICPIPGIARRDSAGNYYFSGSFDGTQNFGGITLVGGWTNNNGQYSPGWPTCYLAKYAGNGSLQWVTGFGQHATRNQWAGASPRLIRNVRRSGCASAGQEPICGKRKWQRTRSGCWRAIPKAPSMPAEPTAC